MDKNGVGWDEASGLQTRKSATVCRMLLHIATLRFQALTPVTPTSSTVGEVALYRGEGYVHTVNHIIGGGIFLHGCARHGAGPDRPHCPQGLGKRWSRASALGAIRPTRLRAVPGTPVKAGGS